MAHAADAERQRQRSCHFVMGAAIKTRLLGSQSDEKLLELARDRSESAFDALARRYRRALLRHCRQLCLSEEMAQEVLRRALSEAQSGIDAGAKPRQLQSWLQGIARRIAVEELRSAGLLPTHEAASLAREAPLRGVEAAVAGAPTPDEVLALRGALAAMSAAHGPDEIVVHRANGNKAKVVVEDAFDVADSAVRGLLGRARRGISALTPPPLLAWAMGRAAEGGASSERMAELGAGGGAAGIAGLAVKGGLAALTAGVAITGAVIAQSKSSHATHARHHAAAVANAAGAANVDVGASAGAVGLAGSGTRPNAGLRRSTPAALKHGRASSRFSTTPLSSGAAPVSQASGHGVASTTSGAKSGSGSAAGSVSAGAQSRPSAESSGGSASAGGGVGVASGSSGTTGTAESTSSTEASGETEAGLSVSLEPLGSVGVRVSLP
jgi:DNA-directed RNA polymerase specialized sigma24 family protein